MDLIRFILGEAILEVIGRVIDRFFKQRTQNIIMLGVTVSLLIGAILYLLIT